MTLDEFIEDFNNVSVDDVEKMGYTFTEVQELTSYLEELKALRVELEVYKKALKITARLLCDFEYCGEFRSDSDEFGCDCEACTRKIADEYLQKAR